MLRNSTVQEARSFRLSALKVEAFGFLLGFGGSGLKALGFHISGLGKFKDRSRRLSDIRVWRIGVGGQGSFSS